MLSHTAMKSFVILTYLVILGSCDRRISNDEKSLDKLLYRSYINNIFRRNAAINEHQFNYQNFQTRRWFTPVNSFVQKCLHLFPIKIKAGYMPEKLKLENRPKLWHNDTKSESFKNMINKNLRMIIAGIPLLGIPSLSPFVFDEPIGFNLGISRLLSITILMRRLKFRGLMTANITNLEVDITPGKSTTCEVTVPKLIIDVDYAISANTLFIPLPTSPEGRVKAIFTNVTVLAAVDFYTAGLADKLIMQGLDAIVDVQDLKVEFAEWLTGNLFGEIINKILNIIFNFMSKLKTSLNTRKFGNEIMSFLNVYFYTFDVDKINNFVDSNGTTFDTTQKPNEKSPSSTSEKPNIDFPLTSI